MHLPNQKLIALCALAGMLFGAAARAGDAVSDPYTLAKTPGAEHKMLASQAGRYDLVSRYWSSPDAEPEITRVPARREMLLDGRVQRLDVGPDPRGFRGTGLSGYDNVARTFWYLWTDTTTTGVASLRGTLAADGTGTLEGTMPTPDGQSPLRVEIRNEGATEVHDYLVPGKDGTTVRFMELRYTPAG